MVDRGAWARIWRPWEHSGIRTASYIACVILGVSFFAGLATCVGNVVTLLDVMGHPRQHIDGAIWIPIHGLAWSLSGTGGTLLAWIGACFLIRYETERLAELAHKAKQQPAQ